MQKYLQLASTSVVIGFSYFAGIFIVFITNQIDFRNSDIFRLFVLISVFVLGYTSILFIIGYNKIRRISKAAREMLEEVNTGKNKNLRY
jgi:ABC-type multidrug transport system fused ATPase/permease subunit